ncbi:RmlC-like cupin [Lindgomyces ingoldianus]|uniref:RmlC-like cupin n=1 Tax=Lindgomyces ingoldianus TaxID=673940 RepID=A0ACB6QUD4_9PLEO|nr:RmlC-like cupin [Lindgomyces ingoldianus]KAF2470628.1 RmlC-like cupin [Lindgomyces ingoldianus]
MWMGAYPELPSYVLSTDEDLQIFLGKDPELPYLLKLLLISKALPLQLHPDKTLAAKLHNQHPSNFTNPNHKPKIVLALIDFEGVCDFKALADIDGLVQLPPLQPFMPTIKKPFFDGQTLKYVVKTMHQASEEANAKTNDTLMQLPKESFGKEIYILDMKQYGKCDNGTVVALVMMNSLQLKAGKGILIPADEIWAYLLGDIIGSVAWSNNALNTGFCPQADRDSVKLFCSSMTFTPHDAEETTLHSQSSGKSANGKT